MPIPRHSWWAIVPIGTLVIGVSAMLGAEKFLSQRALRAQGGSDFECYTCLQPTGFACVPPNAQGYCPAGYAYGGNDCPGNAEAACGPNPPPPPPPTQPPQPPPPPPPPPSGGSCGNGIQEAPEMCDDGNGENDDACTTICDYAHCGDGFIQSSRAEECDDANRVNGDGCDMDCRVEGGGGTPGGGTCAFDSGTQSWKAADGAACDPPVCGNGIVEGKGDDAEECDNGPRNGSGMCDATCEWACKRSAAPYNDVDATNGLHDGANKCYREGNAWNWQKCTCDCPAGKKKFVHPRTSQTMCAPEACPDDPKLSQSARVQAITRACQDIYKHIVASTDKERREKEIIIQRCITALICECIKGGAGGGGGKPPVADVAKPADGGKPKDPKTDPSACFDACMNRQKNRTVVCPIDAKTKLVDPNCCRQGCIKELKCLQPQQPGGGGQPGGPGGGQPGGQGGQPGGPGGGGQPGGGGIGIFGGIGGQGGQISGQQGGQGGQQGDQGGGGGPGCGDGKCDLQNGEGCCNCPQDCPTLKCVGCGGGEPGGSGGSQSSRSSGDSSQRSSSSGGQCGPDEECTTASQCIGPMGGTIVPGPGCRLGPASGNDGVCCRRGSSSSRRSSTSSSRRSSEGSEDSSASSSSSRSSSRSSSSARSSSQSSEEGGDQNGGGQGGGGDSSSSNQASTGSSSSDQCTVPPCSSCGEGLFNLCDANECYSLGVCFYDDGVIGVGGRCTPIFDCDPCTYVCDYCAHCGEGLLNVCDYQECTLHNSCIFDWENETCSQAGWCQDVDFTGTPFCEMCDSPQYCSGGQGGGNGGGAGGGTQGGTEGGTQGGTDGGTDGGVQGGVQGGAQGGQGGIGGGEGSSSSEFTTAGVPPTCSDPDALCIYSDIECVYTMHGTLTGELCETGSLPPGGFCCIPPPGCPAGTVCAEDFVCTNYLNGTPGSQRCDLYYYGNNRVDGTCCTPGSASSRRSSSSSAASVTCPAGTSCLYPYECSTGQRMPWIPCSIDQVCCTPQSSSDASASDASSSASSAGLCGNGILDPDEECDNGTRNSDTVVGACTTECKRAFCGDGKQQTQCNLRFLGSLLAISGCQSEQCDDGNPVHDDGCTNDCRLPYCGDGIVQNGVFSGPWGNSAYSEECDDGNRMLGDGCDSACRIEPQASSSSLPPPPVPPAGDPVHLECLGGMCTLVEGAGNNDCDMPYQGCGEEAHTECQGDACVLVLSAGQNQCGYGTENSCGDSSESSSSSSDASSWSSEDSSSSSSASSHSSQVPSSASPTHAECRSGICVEVSGPGVDQCSPLLQGCGGIGHTECQGTLCVLVQGPGTNACTMGSLCGTTGRCGNGIREGSEACDDGNTRSGDGCDTFCRPEPSQPVCGDGFLTGKEQCESIFSCTNGLACDLKTCSCRSSSSSSVSSVSSVSSLIRAFCGNGILDPGERCDDRNRVSGDGCSNICITEPGILPRCGDGIVTPGEQCDDGNILPGDGCSRQCIRETALPPPPPPVAPLPPPLLPVGVCGDGTLNRGETCDDGNRRNGDGCNGACQLEPGTHLRCGNGIVTAGEECDDGNTRDADGCSSRCLKETGRCLNGSVEHLLGEQCEPELHDLSLPFKCGTDCRFSSVFCGDGDLDPGEECDQGIGNDDTFPNRCRTNCSQARCGDRVLDAGEGCDDGNRLRGDGCDPWCRRESFAAEPDVAAAILPAFPQPLPTQAPDALTLSLLPNPVASWIPPENIANTAQKLNAQLQPIVQGRSPIGETGPGAIAVMAGGAAAGWSWMRRRARKTASRS